MNYQKLVELANASYAVHDLLQDTTLNVTVPVLTAGTIDQASPGIGLTLTVSGSNATSRAAYQWQEAATSGGTFTDIVGATSASLDTTGLSTGFYKRVTTEGLQTVATPEVEVGPAGTFAEQLFYVSGSEGWFAPITAEQYTDTAGTTLATDGDPVANWQNLGDGSLITQDTLADRPVLRDPGGGVPPYVEWDASGMKTSTKPGTAGTIAVHFKSLDGSSDGPAIGSTLDSTTRVVFFSHNKVFYRVGDNPQAVTVVDLTSDQAPHTIAMSWNGSNIYPFLDGVPAYINLRAYGGSTLTDLVFNIGGNGFNAFYGTLGINRVLTAQEHADLHTQFTGYSS